MFTTYFIANLKEYSIDYIICQRKSGNLPPCVTLSHICYHLVLKSKPNNQITLHEKELWLLTGASKKSGTRMKHKYLKESKKKAQWKIEIDAHCSTNEDISSCHSALLSILWS